MRYWIPLSFVLISFFTVANETTEKKNQNDPTKVLTKIGLSYTDDLSILGSLALDKVRKINARTNFDANEWRLGGSWLFNFGILNLSLSRSEYDNDGHKNNYAVGTFRPLSMLGVDIGKWIVFPMAGFNHNTGEIVVTDETTLENSIVMQQNTSNVRYIGAKVLWPITEHSTLLAFSGGGLGSNDYSNN
ncbi:MAG: hypothetical protein ACI9VO_000247 [Colwellia sp.]|jgi:hypothetical protein